MGKEVLRLENVTFAYEGSAAPALSCVSLSFSEGDFAGIIGPVGSGKSTLLYACNGLIPKEMHGKYSGKALLLGKDVSRMGFPEISGLCSIVFQDPDDQIFSPAVLEEVAFGLLNAGMPRNEALKRAKGAIAKVGLAGFEARDPSELSNGQRQKVAIACALAAESRIILLDEPVSSLDYRSCREIYSILSGLAAEGRAIIITEQDTSLLAEHASRIIVVKDGRVHRDGGRALLFSEEMEALGLRVPSFAKLARELGIIGDYAEVKRQLAEFVRVAKKKMARGK